MGCLFADLSLAGGKAARFPYKQNALIRQWRNFPKPRLQWKFSPTFSEVHAMAIALSLTQRPNDRSRAAVCQPFVTRTIQAV
jgi:hypothetical protein